MPPAIATFANKCSTNWTLAAAAEGLDLKLSRVSLPASDYFTDRYSCNGVPAKGRCDMRCDLLKRECPKNVENGIMRK